MPVPATVKTTVLTMLYIVGILMVYPLLSYYLGLGRLLPAFPNQVYIHVYCSGPLLIIVGFLLFFVYRQRIPGSVSFLIGILCIAAVLYEVREGW